MRWGRVARKTGLGLLGLAALLILVLCINALRVERVPERPEKAASLGADLEAASARLARAVGFRTVATAEGTPQDPESFRGLHRLLEESYPQVHRSLERETVNDFSLIYRWPGTDPDLPPILLTAHQDVVPENGEWSRPAFTGQVEGGFVWGRGTLDDKVSVLGILEAVELLLAGGFQPRRTVYLAFGQDEEISGVQGAQAIAGLFAERGLRFWFVLDEGSPLGEGLVPGVAGAVALIGTAEKGYLSVELQARTAGGHSSMPSRASATIVLGEALRRIMDEADRTRMDPPFTDMLAALKPHMGFLGRMILANLWLFEPLILDQMGRIPEARAMISTTAALTIAEAGEADNVLPSHARAVVNLRLLPGLTVEKALQRVEEVVGSEEISVTQYGAANDPSPISDPQSDSYRVLARTVREVFPDALVLPTLVVAATDARHYVGLAEQVYRFLPTRLAPEDLHRLHGVDERIAVENYGEIIDFYGRLILNAAGER